MSAKSTTILILATLAVGTAIGVMLAPESGKQTRKKLVKKSKALHDRLSDMLDEGCELIDKLKSDASDVKRTARDAARSVRDTASSSANG